MTDLTLFNYRRTDPDTSVQAAERASKRAPRHRELAWKTLLAHPEGLTDFELAELTGLAQTSVGKRRGELRDKGFVVDTGKRRPSPSGSPSIVWAVVT